MSYSISIIKTFEVDAGHRLLFHRGKCKNYHGHRYRFEVTVTAARLGRDGVVMDFAKVKELIGGWLDEHWDHGMILEKGDPMIQFLQEQGSKVSVLGVPPTAECLAWHLHEVAHELLGVHGLKVAAVRCFETPTCWASTEEK